MHANCHHPPFVVHSDAAMSDEQIASYGAKFAEDPTSVLIVSQRQAGVTVDVIECSWCESGEAVALRNAAFSELREVSTSAWGNTRTLHEDVENWIDQALVIVGDSNAKGTTILRGMGLRLLERVREHMTAARS